MTWDTYKSRKEDNLSSDRVLHYLKLSDFDLWPRPCGKVLCHLDGASWVLSNMYLILAKTPNANNSLLVRVYCILFNVSILMRMIIGIKELVINIICSYADHLRASQLFLISFFLLFSNHLMLMTPVFSLRLIWNKSEISDVPNKWYICLEVQEDD